MCTKCIVVQMVEQNGINRSENGVSFILKSRVFRKTLDRLYFKVLIAMLHNIRLTYDALEYEYDKIEVVTRKALKVQLSRVCAIAVRRSIKRTDIQTPKVEVVIVRFQQIWKNFRVEREKFIVDTLQREHRIIAQK